MILDWENISRSQELTEQCVAKGFIDKINWSLLCSQVKLTQTFIREYKDYLPWANVCRHQKLSESFMREMRDYIDTRIMQIWNGDHISDKFYKEMKMKNFLIP